MVTNSTRNIRYKFYLWHDGAGVGIWYISSVLSRRVQFWSRYFVYEFGYLLEAPFVFRVTPQYKLLPSHTSLLASFAWVIPSCTLDNNNDPDYDLFYPRLERAYHSNKPFATSPATSE
jgi:hypothetical protein